MAKRCLNSAGLRVERRWRDLHVLSASWIFAVPGISGSSGPRRRWHYRFGRCLGNIKFITSAV